MQGPNGLSLLLVDDRWTGHIDSPGLPVVRGGSRLNGVNVDGVPLLTGDRPYSDEGWRACPWRALAHALCLRFSVPRLPLGAAHRVVPGDLNGDGVQYDGPGRSGGDTGATGCGWFGAIR